MQEYINFYIQQSRVTDLGEFSSIFEELPNDIPALVSVVDNLIFLDSDAALHNFIIPTKDVDDINLRYVHAILTTVFLKNTASLNINREIIHKVIGTCRDKAVLLCALLRAKKIAARVRYGFRKKRYCYSDHVIVEYYDDQQKKLIWVDPSCFSELHRENRRIKYDMYDVTSEHYLTGTDAWHACINNGEDPERFGVGALTSIRGLWFVRNKMLQDFVSLNKIEVLPWDEWGIMRFSEVENNTLLMLKDIANTVLESAVDPQKLKHVYDKYPLIQAPDKMDNNVDNNLIHFRGNLMTNTLINL